jgi:putative molybdopterin biosynthesis protein
MLRAAATLAWLHSPALPREQGAALLRLLAALEDAGTLRAAARRTGISYRSAWNLLGSGQRACGAPLAELRRGHGAALSPAGRRLLELDRRLAAQLAPHLERASREAQAALDALAPGAGESLVVHASHDLALAELRTLAAAAVRLELHFHGSLDSVEALARRRCDVAGFHAGDDDPLWRLLRPRQHRIVQFAVREQGLIVRPGARVRSLRDLTRSGVRFINRQEGSGTRQLLEQLLAAEGVSPARIAGYADEELTHLAVGATIAAGRADAGFGIRAAAVRHGLQFVSLARERYYLACSAHTYASPAFGALRSLMASRRFRSRVARLPGYDVSRAGEPVEFAGAKR